MKKFFLILVIIFIQQHLVADVVKTKDGIVLNGRVVNKTDHFIIFKSNLGTFTLERKILDQIVEISEEQKSYQVYMKMKKIAEEEKKYKKSLELKRIIKADTKITSSFGITTGVIYPYGNISSYLKPSFLSMAHITVGLPNMSWTSFGFTLGYSNIYGKNKRDSMRLLFIPILFDVLIKLPKLSRKLIPTPILMFGCGVTYLSLHKKIEENHISEQGYNPTIAAGIGISINPYKFVYVQADVRYYYIYEESYVNYLYTGLRMDLNFHI